MRNNFDKLSAAAYIFKSIVHPTRLSVLYLLEKQGRMAVNDIAIMTRCEATQLLLHLNEMKRIGLLKSEREGQVIFYSLCGSEFSTVVDCIESCSRLIENSDLVESLTREQQLIKTKLDILRQSVSETYELLSVSDN